MKKILVVLSLFFCLGMSAQGEHVKFMGIDMNCDINTFNEKLTQKGFQYTQELKDPEEESLAFEGNFSGEKASVFVYYDKDSKLVYKVSVGIICLNNQIAEDKYQHFKKGLSVKYNEHYFKEDTTIEKGKTFTVLLLDKEKKSYGGINMYILSNFSQEFPDASILTLGYIDSANLDLHDKKEYEDL